MCKDLKQLSQSDLKTLSEKWPSALVARTEVSKFSGGILHPRTIANYDSRGDGPAGRIKIGNRVAYPVTELIKFLEGRLNNGKN